VPEPPHSGVIHAAPGRQAAIPPPERGGHQGLGRPGYRLRQQASRWLPARRGGCAPSPPAGGRGGCGRRVGGAPRSVLPSMATARRRGRCAGAGWSWRSRATSQRTESWPTLGVSPGGRTPPIQHPCRWAGFTGSAKARGPDAARKWPPTRFPSGDLKAVEGHRPRHVAPPRGPFSLAATSPSALRRPPTPGRFRLRPSRAALPRRHRATA
jgi:hypothetical protein